MRSAFIKELEDLAREDERIFLIIGDLGFGVVDGFKNKFPKRFLNVGIAEQNMTGIAAGLALSGKIVFTYSIANFPTMRCLEQIRNDVCYHNIDVKIVSVGGGLGYGALGSTHHGTEDLAIMRSLPNMTVIAPGDPVESALATKAIYQRPGPCYLRLGKFKGPPVHQRIPEFQIGKAIKIRDGGDIALIATGEILSNVKAAAEILVKQGVQVQLLSMHTIKPLDAESVLAVARDTGKIITVEEHSIIGGLGSAVSEILAESRNSKVIFKRMGLDDTFCHEVGSQDYLRKAHSLSIESIVNVAKKMICGELIGGRR